MVQVKCATVEENKSHCDSNPCINGQCVGVINDFYCSCESHLTGKLCADAGNKGINLAQSLKRSVGVLEIL